MSEPRAALYLRLSRDDEGAGESASIVSQRDLLRAYADAHGYAVAGEYVDDGYSGTSFDRPAFQRMLRDIEAGRLDLVLTKDLSRLGRDYIRAGEYTELYFPAHRVRYIAVNDGYDSENGQSAEFAPFRHVVNELYARDASKKIRTAFAARMLNGRYIGHYAPYGYRKDPADKNHLLPDEGAAPTVREIFARAADGARPADIARGLDARGVPPPAAYRAMNTPGLTPPAPDARWQAATIGKLLRNPVYLGHLAQGKTRKVSFKSKTTVRNPREDWVVVRDTHEPLVSEACFDAVQARLRGRALPRENGFCNLFSGLARCADCGRGMSTVGTRKKSSPAALACGGYKLRGTAACSNHFIDYNALYALVLDAVRRALALPPERLAAAYRLVQTELGREARKTDSAGRADTLTASRDKAARMIEQLYDDRMQGRLSEAHFYPLLQKYEAQCKELERALAAPPPAEAPAPEIGLPAAFRACARPEELDAALLFTLIDRIEVCQGAYEHTETARRKRQTVRVYFRFDTPTEAYEYEF